MTDVHLSWQFLNEMEDIWVQFFLAQIVSGVCFMHRAGIVHRDLKSDNIMVRYPDRKIVIIDFGLTKKMNLPLRAHCPAPMSISNGYYFTDRSSEAPLALPKRSQEKYERGTIARSGTRLHWVQFLEV